MMSLSRFFSPLAAPRAIALGVAFAALATLSGCGTDVPPISAQIFDGLHSKPVHSYALVPVVKDRKDSPPAYTGKFQAVIKKNEIVNPHAVDEKGETGQMTCSTFQIIPLTLNEEGNLTAQYIYAYGRYSRSARPVVTPKNGQMDIPPTYEIGNSRGDIGALDIIGNYSLCKFTPAAKP